MSEPALRDASPVAGGKAVTRQIRGSGLLVLGRVLSLALTATVQVVIVRYLTKQDYGAFAYGLALAMSASTLATFGLGQAVARFSPIYDERGDHARLVGTVVLGVGTVTSLSFLVVLACYGLAALGAGWFIDDERTVSLLLILIVLVPVQSLDNLLVAMFAVFSKPRSIFFRRYVVAPGLRLAVVLVLVLSGSGVGFLAVGYVATGAIGIAVYAVVLFRLLRRRGLVAQLRERVIVPAREVLSFTVPVLTSDLLFVVIAASGALLLGHYHGPEAVADFRVIWPAATFNLLVQKEFALLFAPLAARLFARDDRAGLNDLYWQTAVWMAVLAFPVFAVTFALAEPLTVALFGARYGASATFLAVLSAGYYLRAALGLSALTLKVLGKLRYTVAINLAAVVVNLAAGAVLIPLAGALGAAAATCGTIVVHALVLQVGLRLAGTGVSGFPREYLPVFATIAVCAPTLLVVQVTLQPPLVVALALVVAGCLAVLVAARKSLRAEEAFPELLRFRVLRVLFGSGTAGSPR